MAYNYDKLYGDTPNALGTPTDVFVQFFDKLEHKNARVLDIGCGQGRDALFIARQGHSVVGVDISPHGVRDLLAAAQKENLAVEGVVADLTHYTPDCAYDVVLFDRTLHMLARSKRLSALMRLLDHVAPVGWLLIADEASNMEDFERVIAAHRATWKTEYSKRGYLFTRRT